jgi:glycosyltransferase involved in cell wall biosynthesis
VASARIELILLCLYLLFGPQAWAFYGMLMHAGRRKMLLLRRPPGPFTYEGQAVPPPRVCLLIPAKDEGERIRGCIESALAQDYPNLDVIAVNDRSDDDTGAVMDEMAAANPRLKVLHNRTAPPAGWTGKNNALHQGVQHPAAKAADWLLFVDSDVFLEPDALSASMAVVLRKKFDLISLLPRLESHSLWEGLLVPLAASAASSMYLVPLTNNHLMPNQAFANGQFLMISRPAYEALGGHEAVRDKYCEDVEIARILKPRGWKPRVAWGSEFCSVRMYSSLASIFKGWGRIYYAGRNGSPWRVMLAALFLVLCCFSGYAALAWGLWRLAHPATLPGVGAFGYYTPTFSAAAAWLVASVVHLVVMTWFVGTMYRWSGNRRRNALMFPLAGSMLMAIFLKALRMCVTKKVEWRGTNYAHVMAPDIGNAAQPAKPG